MVCERTSGEEQIIVADRGNVQRKEFVRRLNGGLRGEPWASEPAGDRERVKDLIADMRRRDQTNVT